MKKTFFSFITLAVSLVSCQNQNEESPLVNVCFNVASPMTISTGDITRASLSEANATNLYVLVDGALTVTQASTDEQFGSPVIPLEVGQHTLVFVASPESLTLANGYFSYPEGKVKDTFGKIVTLTVTGGMSAQPVELQRIVTKCSVTITDAIPSKLSSVNITQDKGSNTFSATTLLGKADGLSTTTAIPSSYVGTTNATLNALSTCASITDTYQQDVTVDFKTSDGTTFVTETVEDVEMLVNRRTVISGEWMSTAPSHVVSVNATWQDDHTVQK